MRLRASLAMVDGTGGGELPHAGGLPSGKQRGAGGNIHAGAGAAERRGTNGSETGDAGWDQNQSAGIRE